MIEIGIALVIQRHKDHWFSPSNMRFFGTRLPHYAYQNEATGLSYFVTSEASRWANEPRRYSVRVQKPDGSIDTIGEFHSITSRARAHSIARKLAKS